MDRNLVGSQVTGDVGTIAQRRKLVTALYGGYAVFCFAITVGLQLPNPLRLAGLAALLVSFATMWWGFFTLTGLLFGNKPASLDPDAEIVLQARRETIKRRARPLVVGALGAAVLYVAIAFAVYPALKSLPLLIAVILGACLIAATLPTTLVAWSEPDPAPNPYGEDPYAVIKHNIPSIKLFGE